MDPEIIASLIGAIAIFSVAFISYLLTKKNLKERYSCGKGIVAIGNIAHRKRNYYKTKDLISSLLKESYAKEQIPDLYITNLGTPVEHLTLCDGFDDYQKYLQKISRDGECVIHRYHTVHNKASKEHVDKLKEELRTIAHSNLYINHVKRVNNTVINFLIFSNIFAATTLETAAKIQISFNTRDADEVLGVKEFLLAMQPEFTPVILQGKLFNENE